MQDNLKQKFKMEDDLNFYFEKRRRLGKNGRRPQKNKMEDNLQRKMEDDLKK
jgi:hypothetical protein